MLASTLPSVSELDVLHQSRNNQVHLKKQTRQLDNQRLPGINAAKIRIILETSKYFCNYLRKILYTHHFSAYLGYMIQTID